MTTGPTEIDTAGRPIPVVALTGGIASGKTAVSDRFAALGVPVVDTDTIAREVVAPGTSGLAAVVAEFGPEILDADGGLDRAALRRRIFSDPAARRRLESILHPRIAAEARRRIDAAEGPYAVLVVPLLVESGLFADADRVLVVDVPESMQVERLLDRDGMDADAARAALDAQAPRSRRLAAADDVIDNSGSLQALDDQVRALDRAYRRRWSEDPGTPGYHGRHTSRE